MAFSFKRILSNITYFKKPGEEDVDSTESSDPSSHVHKESEIMDFECVEPDSTSKQCASSLKIPNSVKKYTAKKGSLSDTDLLTINTETSKKDKKKGKDLTLDIKNSSQPVTDHVSSEQSGSHEENTPKHVLLDSKSADLFSQHFKGFDQNTSYDLFDVMSNNSSISDEEENIDIESLPDESETDISLESDGKEEIKMCRKVEPVERKYDSQLQRSVSSESFGEVEVDKNEEERQSVLANYQTELDKLDICLKNLLTDFKFHIEVSKIFQCRSAITSLPNAEDQSRPPSNNKLDFNNQGRLSSASSWNVISETDDEETRTKVKNQLSSMKNYLDGFIRVYLENQSHENSKKFLRKNVTYDMYKGKRQKRLLTSKKRSRYFDFPDIRDAMINLFEVNVSTCSNKITNLLNESNDESKCNCSCRHHGSPSEQTDSGLTKNDTSSHSITSSIGNFTLDTSTLTAYSESLDLIVSYNSFEDTLYSTLLQKPAIERITFYVQVHSIQLKCDQPEEEFESKNIITFFCPTCKTVDHEENGLLKHILSQMHCEKIHFVYKTAYIKKCVAAGKEIMPSTVLNPMTMYRDENKIVCFGDAMYGCSLCFENLIVGESVLMAHCMDPEHINHREMLSEILE